MYRTFVVGCIFLRAFFTTSPGLAQDSTSVGKWEVGIDLYSILTKQTSPFSSKPYTSLLLRKQIGKCTALRVRFGMDFSLRKRGLPTDSYYYIRPGYEFTKNFSKRSSLHYGMDLQYEKEKVMLYFLSTSQTFNVKVEYFPTYRRVLGTGIFLGL